MAQQQSTYIGGSIGAPHSSQVQDEFSNLENYISDLEILVSGSFGVFSDALIPAAPSTDGKGQQLRPAQAAISDRISAAADRVADLCNRVRELNSRSAL